MPLTTDKPIHKHLDRCRIGSLLLSLLTFCSCSYFDTDKARSWHAFRSTGEAAALKEDWAGAKTSFQSALKEVESLPNETMRVAISLKDLSSVCLHEIDNKLADRLANRALLLLDKPALSGNDSNDLFTQRELGQALNNLGDYYLKQVKDFDQALLLYSKAETLFEGLVRHHQSGSFDCIGGYHLANSLIGSGRAYAALQKEKEAAQTYLKALDPELLPAIPEVARRQLVTAYAELPQLAPGEAADYAKKCDINTNDKQLPEDILHQYLARGRQLIRLEQLVKAREQLLEAQKIAETLPQPSRHLAEVLQTLGILYIKQMDFVEAESVLLKAVSLFEKTNTSDPRLLADCLFTLSTMYLRANKPEKAEPYALQRRKLWLEANGPSDLETAKADLFVAEVYYQGKKFDASGKYYGEAADALHKSERQDLRLIARADTGVAAVLVRKGNYAAAKPILEKALEFWHRNYQADSGSADVAEALYSEVKQHLGISSRVSTPSSPNQP
jgi:tetratricopeptide (TPR) repeat protein